MAKRKSTRELIAELKLFNHHESAAKMESLDAEVRSLREALATAADECERLRSCPAERG